MRASSVAPRLSETTTVPAITSPTSSPIRSLARSRSVSERATRLCVSRLSSSDAGDSAVAAGRRSSRTDCMDMGLSLPAVADFPVEPAQLVGVGQHVAEQVFELFVAGHLVAQLGQSRARFEQCAQRLDLTHHRFGAEILQLVERQVDGELAAFTGQL